MRGWFAIATRVMGGYGMTAFGARSGHSANCWRQPVPVTDSRSLLVLSTHLPSEIRNDGRAHRRDRLERSSERQVSKSELAHDVCHTGLNDLAIELFSHRGRGSDQAEAVVFGRFGGTGKLPMRDRNVNVLNQRA
jgi:hypothetical protein